MHAFSFERYLYPWNAAPLRYACLPGRCPIVSTMGEVREDECYGKRAAQISVLDASSILLASGSSPRT